MTDTRIALVLGATGGIGGEVARALLQRGWHVRGLHREPERAVRRAPHLAQVQWVAGDAMRREDVVAAAQGADVIVHGVNPPGYRNWRGLALPMLESSMAAGGLSRRVSVGQGVHCATAGDGVDRRRGRPPPRRSSTHRLSKASDPLTRRTYVSRKREVRAWSVGDRR